MKISHITILLDTFGGFNDVDNQENKE